MLIKLLQMVRLRHWSGVEVPTKPERPTWRCLPRHRAFHQVSRNIHVVQLVFFLLAHDRFLNQILWQNTGMSYVGRNDGRWKLQNKMSALNCTDKLPVVPRKAVAEVSKIGNL